MEKLMDQGTLHEGNMRIKNQERPGVVAHGCNSRRRQKQEDHPSLHSKTLLRKRETENQTEIPQFHLLFPR
jgi:hypothetical protein